MSDVENPPAFPNTGNSVWQLEPTEGMTLRDWFAGQAIGHIVAAAASTHAGIPTASMAKDAYLIADAMLRARLPAAALDALGGE